MKTLTLPDDRMQLLAQLYRVGVADLSRNINEIQTALDNCLKEAPPQAKPRSRGLRDVSGRADVS